VNGSEESFLLCEDHDSTVMTVKKPERSEQRELWKGFLSAASFDAVAQQISRLVGQSDLSGNSIQAAVKEASVLLKDGRSLNEALWDACRLVTRPQMGEMAVQIVIRDAWMIEAVFRASQHQGRLSSVTRMPRSSSQCEMRPMLVPSISVRSVLVS
jgi:hypothetical protein